MAEVINFPDINTEKTSGFWNNVKYIFGSREQAIRRYGRKGEKKVSACLMTNLPNTFLVVNNYPLGRGLKKHDIDHLVIGPTGIFCIDTKSEDGSISVTDNGFERVKIRWGNIFPKKPKRHDRQVCGQISHLKKDVLLPCGFKDWVYGVLCFPYATIECDNINKVKITTMDTVIPAIIRSRPRSKPADKDAYKVFFLKELDRVLKEALAR